MTNKVAEYLKCLPEAMRKNPAVNEVINDVLESVKIIVTEVKEPDIFNGYSNECIINIEMDEIRKNTELSYDESFTLKSALGMSRGVIHMTLLEYLYDPLRPNTIEVETLRALSIQALRSWLYNGYEYSRTDEEEIKLREHLEKSVSSMNRELHYEGYANRFISIFFEMLSSVGHMDLIENFPKYYGFMGPSEHNKNITIGPEIRMGPNATLISKGNKVVSFKLGM